MKAIYKVGVMVEGNEFIEEFIFERYTVAQTKFRALLRDAMMNGPSVGIVVMREYLLKGDEYECTGDIKAVDLEDFDRDALALERSNKVFRSILRDIAGVAGIDEYAALETYAERIGEKLASAVRSSDRPIGRFVSPGVFETMEGEFALHLTGFEKKIETIRVLRAHLGTGLKETKDFVDVASPENPSKVTGLTEEQADVLLYDLESPTGCKVYINNPKLLPASDEAADIHPEG